jgi:hypothetical protein
MLLQHLAVDRHAFPRVTYPTMPSGGSGLQQRARFGHQSIDADDGGSRRPLRRFVARDDLDSGSGRGLASGLAAPP